VTKKVREKMQWSFLLNFSQQTPCGATYDFLLFFYDLCTRGGASHVEIVLLT
jgi:hypothetical protein